ncbi:MAG: NusG domain II-containing protein [Eubacterium sp.]|nr:NusG domain II-containing protein [Eubacterium sp.]
MKKLDIIIAAVVLVAAAVAFLCINSFASVGKTVVVEQNGTVIAELPLDEDIAFEVKSDGRVTNVVEIKNGEASVTSADCPDKICVHHRAVKKSGESIICLPNKVVVSVSGGGEVDGVAR